MPCHRRQRRKHLAGLSHAKKLPITVALVPTGVGFSADACFASATRFEQRKRRCGSGDGKTPTAAVSQALTDLAGNLKRR